MGLSQTRAFVLLRYTLIAATAYLLLVENRFALPPAWAMLLIAAALASNVAAALLPAAALRSVPFAAGVILVDTLWITAVLVSSGHFSADFFYLYFFVLLLAAVGERLSLVAIAAALLCGFYAWGHLASGGTWSAWSSPSVIRLPFLFAAAVFYGHLVDRVRQERRRADAKEETARQLERALQELRIAHARSEESDRLKSTFLATVSHELRTPLVAIIGYVDLLLEGVFGRLSREQEDAVARVQSAGTNLYQLIAGLLDASRIDLGQETLVVGEVDLDALLRDLHGEFGGGRAVHVHVPRQVDVPALVTDAAKLRRILANLLENAVRFTERGVVTVDVRWDPVRDRVELRVSDTGPGIPEDQFEQIFEAFRQGGDRPHATVNGVGLGLYIVRRLAALLGGQVSVTSKVGEGSTFTVSLPRQPQAAALLTSERGGALAH